MFFVIKEDYDVLATLKNVLLEECTFKLSTDIYFVLACGKEEVIIEFHSRFFCVKLPSELIFAQSVKKIKLSTLPHGVVCINKRLTYITNDTLTSRHECVFDMGAFDLNTPRHLANCKANISFCDEIPPIYIFHAGELFCTKRSHNRSKTISANVNYVLKLVLQV